MTPTQLYAIKFDTSIAGGVSVDDMQQVARAKRKLIIPLLTAEEIKFARARNLLDFGSQAAKSPKDQVAILRRYLVARVEEEKLFRPAIIISTDGLKQRSKDHWKVGQRVLAYTIKGIDTIEPDVVIRDGPYGKHQHSIVNRYNVRFL